MLDYTSEISGYAVLHKQICDNFPKCPAMIACKKSGLKYGHLPAIFLNNGKIDIKKENCIGCGYCLNQCGLFRIVTSRYAELKYQEEFGNDPRNKMDFWAERFGCDIVNKMYLLNDLLEVKEYIASTQSNKINILEFVDESNVMCPFQAIEVDNIRNHFSCIGEYKKFIIQSTDFETFKNIEEEYQINQFPAILLLYKGGAFGDPILTEFRVSSEDQRMNVQVSLQFMFAQKLELILNRSLVLG